MTNLSSLPSKPNSETVPAHLRGTLIVGLGVLIISFDALLIRLAETDGWSVAFWRGLFMALSLGLFLVFRRGRTLIDPISSSGWAFFVSSTLFGLGSLFFVLSISHTTVANTVVILSVSPLFAAFFSRFWLQETVRPRTWIAIGVAIAGVVVVFYGSLDGGGGLGDMIALLAALTLGSNLTLLRRHPRLSRVTIIGLSGLLTAVIAWPLADPLSLSWQSYGVLAVMGLIQMPVALVLIAMGPRFLPSPEVSLLLLLETVLGPVWVWMAIGEQPALATLVGGTLIVVTLAVHSWFSLRETRRRYPH